MFSVNTFRKNNDVFNIMEVEFRFTTKCE